MKLAEALQNQADLKKRIQHLLNNATTQEGENPAEESMLFLDELNVELKQLTDRINLTNCSTKLDNFTLTEMIEKRDFLADEVSKYQGFLSITRNVGSCNTPAGINATKLHEKERDKCSWELQAWDKKIQELNLTTELL